MQTAQETSRDTTHGERMSLDEAVDFAAAFELDGRVSAVLPDLDAPFFQAGLAGYSDAAMRLMARRQGCPYCITEALLDRLLLAGGRGLAKADPAAIGKNVPESRDDHPLAGQIMGSHPEEMAEAAGLLASMGYDVIDVNLACPVKKIARKCRGGHFLSHPDEAVAILRAVRDAVAPHIPTTVKLRRGTDDSRRSAERFERIFEAAYDMGYSWATVHGRTVAQKYVGPSRWEFLGDLVARHPDKIIFGSGDIWEAADIFRMLAQTGVHAVSVARGCIGNPWIFRQARQMLAGRYPTAPTLAEQRRVLLDHFDLCVAEHGQDRAGRLMRKFGIKFSGHHPDPDSVKAGFIGVRTMGDWRAVVDRHYIVEGTCDA